MYRKFLLNTAKTTDTQIHRYTDTQIHRYTDTQIHRYTDTQIPFRMGGNM
ncbi:LuxR family transcriptional regulator, partial [Escherichia coli]|nr:LuxR family transcriptional regulator [Escherichia coli]